MAVHLQGFGTRPLAAAAQLAQPFTAGYFGFTDKLNKGHDSMSLTMNWVYFFVKVLIMLITLGSVILCIIISLNLFTYDGTDFKVYLTNTFYATPDNEPNITWQVLSQPLVDFQSRSSQYSDAKFEHFYECLWISRLKVSSCTNETLQEYTSCLKGQQNAVSILDSCAVSYSVGQAWPSATAYTNCLNQNFGGSRRTLNALRTCVKIKPWPVYEVPQEIDSAFFLGSFSWPMLMITGFFLFLLFGIYTVNPMDWEDTTVIEFGKPIKRMGLSRMGMFWIIVALVGAFGWAIACILISFRAGSTWPNANANPFPSTQSTNIITVSASLFAVIYFLLELSEYFDRRVLSEPEKESKGEHEERGEVIQPASAFRLPVNMVGGGMYTQAVQNGLGYYFPDPTKSVTVSTIKVAATQYAPVLLRTWSDAYIFDVIFFTGAIGATMQLGTAEISNLFWALVYYRLAHMGVARMIYESYVRGGFEDEDVNILKDKGMPEHIGSEPEKASLCMKINALALHFAALCSLFLFYSIVSNKYHMLSEYTALQDLCFYGIYLPELLRILGHVYVLLRTNEVEGAKGVYILIFSHFIWMWDMGIRLLFVYLYFYGLDTYIGTKPFLLDKYYTLNATIPLSNNIW